LDFNIILIHPQDNVAVAVSDIKAGQAAAAAEGLVLTARTNIPGCHKIAIARIPADSDVVKYGEVIGSAVDDIEPGEWVHAHNMKSGE
jgi:altronate dehydratase